MRIIGVVDLRGGQAVHAVGGMRATYLPVRTLGGEAIPQGDAVALATGYRDGLGVTELYCADLDAISGEPWQASLIAALVDVGLPLWLDAGLSTVEHGRRGLAVGASHLVVGLETMQRPCFDVLTDICRAVGRERIAFSLDLRHGVPIGALCRVADGATPWALAALAMDAGASSIIVLDLARVGTGGGLDIEMFARVRSAVPSVALLAGGGVRNADDLTRLADAGCDGVLVATALQDGWLTAADIAAARVHQRGPHSGSHVRPSHVGGRRVRGRHSVTR
jgi:phosphoribosylformimino-5-aminoimidazole carboxamide ribotide isomerase